MTQTQETISKRTLIIRYLNLSGLSSILLALIVLSALLILAYIRYQYISTGFTCEDINYSGFLQSYDSYIIKKKGSAVISGIKFRGAAAKARLKVGDSVIAVNNSMLNQYPNRFDGALFNAVPGDSIIYDIIRKDKKERHILYIEPNRRYFSPQGTLRIWTENLTPKLIDSFHIKTPTGVFVNEVDTNSPAGIAGIKKRDVIVKIDNVIIRNKTTLDSVLEYTIPSQIVSIEYIRGDSQNTALVTLTTPPKFGIYFFGGGYLDGSPEYVITVLNLPMILMPLILLFFGTFIGWSKIGNTAAYQCSIWFLWFGVYSLQMIYHLFTVPFRGALPMWLNASVAFTLGFSAGIMILLSLKLFSIFPNSSRSGVILLRYQWIVIIFIIITTIIKLVFVFVNYYLWDPPAIIRIITMEYMSKYTILEDFSMAGITIWLLFAQRRETRGRSQIRLKIIEGSILIFSIGVVIYLLHIQVLPEIFPNAWEWSRGEIDAWFQLLFPLVGLVIVSLAFAYTILSQKLFNIRFLIRKGLRYLLLSKGALLVEGIIVFLIVIQILSYAGTEYLNSPTAVGGVAVASTLVVIAVVGKVNRKLMPAIDRRFFREALDVKRLLMELNEKLSEMKEREKILQQTASTVLKALHPARVVMLLKDGKGTEFKCVLVEEHETKSSPSQTVIARTLSEAKGTKQSDQLGNQIASPDLKSDSQRQSLLKASDPIITQIEEKKGWAIVYPEKLVLEKVEDQRLSAVNCELLIAIKGSSGLVGIMGLGSKLSEEPYSKEDRELLMTVAREMGIALENAELLEVAKREAEYSKELDIARQVQQNLFPTKLPTPSGWEFAGICKPAKAVGGDYYDIFEAVPGKVVVALGDVSGKGLGASFVMSGVHSTIRTNAEKSIDNPVVLINELNKYLLGSTSKNIFVTLFLGIIDLETGQLSYVNCGHPPAFVVRKENGEIEKLTRTGFALGMMGTANFTQGSSTLKPDDSLIVYSDGVTEAMNEKEEMFEEERLIRVLQGSVKFEANQIMGSILENVIIFAGTHEQADDLSIIVAQRTMETV